MNILIKNADFSEVAIGQVDTYVELDKKAIVTHVYYVENKFDYIASNSRSFFVDVSALQSKEIKIKGKLGSTKYLGLFYGVDCPTEDVAFNNLTEVNSYNSSLGTPKGILKYPDDESTTTIKTVTVPSDAKCLAVNVGTSDVDDFYVKYSVI